MISTINRIRTLHGNFGTNEKEREGDNDICSKQTES